MTDMDKEEKPVEIEGNELDEDQKSDQPSEGPRNETSPERAPESMPLEQ